MALITENRRAMLHTFGVKVHVFPDRVEVRGAIPTQLPELSESEPEPAETPALIISPASPSGEGGEVYGGATPLQGFPLWESGSSHPGQDYTVPSEVRRPVHTIAPSHFPGESEG